MRPKAPVNDVAGPLRLIHESEDKPGVSVI